jgi:transporter family-2 protein
MSGFWLYVVVAIIGGLAITLQAQFMGLMDQASGTRESVFVTYAGGGLVIALVMIGMRGGNLRAISSVPPFALSAGLLGLLIVGSIGFTVPRLGLVTAFTVLVASQFLSGALIDHFGWLGAQLRPMDLSRWLGVAIMLVGVYLVARGQGG